MQPPPVLAVSFGPLYDSEDNGGLSRSDIERLVDEDINKFGEYFGTELQNGALSAPERAIIKTYLAYKLLVT